MFKRKRTRRGISAGTSIMLLCTVAVLAGFFTLLPSLTGNQDILIDAARLSVAMDESFSQLTFTTSQALQNHAQNQQTIKPPFFSHTSEAASNNQTSAVESGATAAAMPTPTVSPKHSFSLCAAGSVELNSDVRKAFTYNKETHYELLTDQIQQSLQADLSILTLQNTISSSSNLSNVNMSQEILPSLRSAGVNTINLGHINALNFGKEGLQETAQAIRDACITPFGAQEPTLLSLDGITVALLHYQNSFSSTSKKLLTETERTALFSPIKLEQIQADITDVRNNGAHIVVVTLWWGENKRSEPSDEQIVQAQAIADAGADIILGTGNGALQPVKVLSANRGDGKYHPVLCAYSLGNLFSPDRESRVTLASILLKTDVIYDASAHTVAFENLVYTPTYAWRGKDDGKTIQRILINNPTDLPDFVDSNQRGVMERCLTLVTTVMEDTAIPLMY